MPRRNASSVPAPSIAPSGIHDSEVTDDSMRKTGSFVARPALSLDRRRDARGLEQPAEGADHLIASRVAMEESPPGRSGADPWALAELFALTGLVIAQPVLDVTGRSPDMFLFRRADRVDILMLVAAVTVLPALTIWLLEVLAGLVGATARRLLHLAAVTGLLVLLAVEVVKATTGLRGPGLAAVAAAGGLGGGVLYASLSWPRLWLRFLTPAPLIFALLFLLVSPTSALVLPARTATGQGPAAAAPGSHPPVVMILFDEFPLSSLLDHKGRIDKRVYPNFAELAGQSTWYRNASGVAGFTPWALPAMLTGNYPGGARAPSYTEYPDNLFSLFGRSYHVTAYETLTQLCPPRHCTPAAGDPQQSGLRGVGPSAATAPPALRRRLRPGPVRRPDPATNRVGPALRGGRGRGLPLQAGRRLQPAGPLRRLPGRPEGERPAGPALPAPAAAPRSLALPAVGQRVQLQDLRRCLPERPAAGSGDRAGPPAAPASAGLHRPAGRAGHRQAQGRGHVGPVAGREGGPTTASAGHRASQAASSGGATPPT